MNPFEKAKKLFSKNQFAAAANSYYEALSEDVLSYQLKVDCYQKILKICQFTKTKFDPIEIKKELAAFYMQNKQWSRAVDEYSKIIPASRNGATLENYWTCLHQDGQIKMANECLVDLLEYLLKRKNIRFCLEVLKSAEEREAPTKIISTYKVKAFVIQGNKAQVDTELEGVLSDSMLGIKNHSGAIYRHLEEVVLLERNYWKTTRAIQEVKLQGLVNDFKRGNVSKSKSLQNRKEFIKSIYDYILNFDENVGTLGLIVKYAQFFERKELGEKALALLEEGHKLRDFRNKSFNIIKIKEYLSTLEESKRFETEDFDLGTDLFSDLSDESEEDLK
ncbi:MAG: hypothetical protein HOM21_01595, partial [Halobacteriovoraceae bacterium]|nr:hypothetical protein [Halobacteriovoraceae bacterium]